MRHSGRVLFPLLAMLALSPALCGQTITTVAGNGTAASTGDGGQATAASLNSPSGAAVDSSGNLFIADTGSSVIRKVNASTGIITTVAGNGSFGFSGDGGPATAASLNQPNALAIDGAGNLFISDITNNRVRRVTNGTITTVAGDGTAAFGGDGGPATAASLNQPTGVAVDGSGNLFIADRFNGRVRRVDASTGIITTVAGNGSFGFSGDGGPATAAPLNHPTGVAVDGSGNLFIVDSSNQRIRQVSNGVITTVAGNGTHGFSGDGGPATAAALNFPWGIAVDGAGNLFVADQFNFRVRRVDASTGIITTVAGTGQSGFSGDGGPATAANVDPFAVALDSTGNLFIADPSNSRIRRVGSAGQSSGGSFSESVNAGAAPSFLIWATVVTDVGWFYTPGQSYNLTGVRTAFLPIQASDTGDRVVTLEFLTAPRADGGTLLGTATFNSAIARGVLGGADFASSIPVTAGTRYFVGFRNVQGLGINVTGACGAANNGCNNGPSHFDPNFNTATSLPPGLRIDNNSVNNGQYAGFNPDTTCNGLDCPILQFLGSNVSNPAPAITGILPACLDSSAAGMNVRLMGSGFIAGSVVQWNGSARTTQFVNGATLEAVFTATDLGAAGTAVITVVNPTPGGGTSNHFAVTVPRSCTDTPAGAPPVIQTPASLVVTSTGSPASTVSPPCGNQSAAKGVWMSYTAAADGTLNADTVGSTYQAIFAVYTGSPTNLTNVACAAAPPGSMVRGDTILPLAAALALPVTKGTTYLFLVTAANSDGGKLQFNLTFTGSARLPSSTFVTMLPHMVNGAGYITKLTVVNMSGAQNNVVINFLGQDGSIQSTQTILMQAGQTVRLAAPESARNLTPQTNQWVTVGGDGRVAVNLFFEVEDGNGTVINCIGFNDASSATAFTVPVEFEPKPANASIGRTVGVALANPSASSNTVTLTLLDQNGATLGTLPVTLGAFGKTGIDLSSTTTGFGNVLPASNFIGTLTGTSPAPFSVIALGDDFGPFFATPSLTTATTQVVPHIVSGAGYVTKITLVNLSAGSNTVTVTYFNQAGVQQGSPHTFVIPAFGTARDTTGEANRFITPSTTQWAVVTSTAAAGVNLFFEFMDSPTARLVVNTVGFNAAPELSTFTVPVEWQPGVGNSIGRTMGFAVANRNASAASITVTLLNNQGAVVATHALTLGANSQTTFNIDTFTELAAALPASNFIGAVVVTSNLPVAAIALEDDLGPFSATPVISGRL
jgi:sugar lactone lactonase YvrE